MMLEVLTHINTCRPLMTVWKLTEHTRHVIVPVKALGFLRVKKKKKK